MPLAYPPLVYLIGRLVWIGWRGRAPPARPVWPVWVLAAATVFLVGFRIGLNVEASNVIDVGYAGVIGAHRIVHGRGAVRAHSRSRTSRPPCGAADSDGDIRERIQTNGRCEPANERGDTYGPVAYLAYVPGYLALRLEREVGGRPAGRALHVDRLRPPVPDRARARRPALRRHAARRRRSRSRGPRTRSRSTRSNSNTNDAIVPAFLIWGFWLASSPARGARSSRSPA